MLLAFIQPAHATQAATAAGQPSVMMQILMFVPIIAAFYFFIIRPQSKRVKEHRAMVDALAVGNEVVFAGGLIGTIKKLEGDYAVVSLGTHDVKIQRASVLSVLPAGTIAGI